MTFGENLKKIRLNRHMTQQQMADDLYVSRSTLANWENNNRMPEVSEILRIASILEVPAGDLIPVDSYLSDIIDHQIEKNASEYRKKLFNEAEAEKKELEKSEKRNWEKAEKQKLYINSMKLLMIIFPVIRIMLHFLMTDRFYNAFSGAQWMAMNIVSILGAVLVTLFKEKERYIHAFLYPLYHGILLIPLLINIIGWVKHTGIDFALEAFSRFVMIPGFGLIMNAIFFLKGGKVPYYCAKAYYFYMIYFRIISCIDSMSIPGFRFNEHFLFGLLSDFTTFAISAYYIQASGIKYHSENSH